MLKVAYVCRDSCGLGHAVRGMALVQAGRRAGVEVRAFGPPKAEHLPGYEGSPDWEARVLAWRPGLLLADIWWEPLLPLKDALGVPGWLLMRWMRPDWLVGDGVDRWERRISIEPAEDAMPGITDCIPPIIDVTTPLLIPVDGQEVLVGYHAYWRAVWFGYRDRVRWSTAGKAPDSQARLDAGGEMTENGADVLMRMILAR